ncbi:hypothetical protein BD779DRAFT_1501596 [Infundibulicybe gibba]|nr:hypothetical protein BD779DRAFT_1501596 [Infundibulicybe gibba]
MSRFRPTRASPPAKKIDFPDVSTLSDVSRASVVSAPELTRLSPDDIELLDAVIQRAGPSATTFLTVFKAYNDVLSERGLDEQEVVYYGKLLKLGTVRGKNWGDKWAVVKKQHMVTSSEDTDPRYTSTRPNNPARERTTAFLDNMDYTPSDLPQYHHTPPSASIRADSPTQSVVTSESFGLTTDLESRANVSSVRGTDPIQRAPPTTKLQQPSIPKLAPYTSSQVTSSDAARMAVAQARNRRGSIINENEAWKKIQMERDEKDAVKFHDERLLERCWDVWKQGLEWITVTNEQIGQARDNLIVRRSLQRWHTAVLARQEVYMRVTALANTRRLRSFINIWRTKLRAREQIKWRTAIRSKMKQIKEKREAVLTRSVFARWRQRCRLHDAERQYQRRHLAHFLGLCRVDDRAVARCWTLWRTMVSMRSAESTITEATRLRVLTSSMNVWKKNMRDYYDADACRRLSLMKSALCSWKKGCKRIQILERRVIKYTARQDDILLRAVLRVWKAREGGKWLERAMAVRLLKQRWDVWKQQMEVQQRARDRAVAFHTRAGCQTVISAIQVWRQVYTTHQNASTFAAQYYSGQLADRVLLTWRIRLRENLKSAKMARLAHKFFTARHAWRTWVTQLDGKRRERILKKLEMRKLHNSFHFWLRRLRDERKHKLLVEVVGRQIDERLLRNALACWTNRVIELKLRELVASQKYDRRAQIAVFSKWKSVCARHFEEQSLMDSYQYVKREEQIRRIFYRWLSAARATRHRRLTLQRKEDAIKLSATAAAWEKWREAFSRKQLRPIADAMVSQTRRNLIFRTFGIWHSKTKTLPAIRFHADHTKAKFFRVWLRAMPQALRAKLARETDKKAMLTRFLDKWVQKHRTTMALKAVARARYLRLPTSAPRQTPVPRQPPAITPPTRIFPRRAIRRVEDAEDKDKADDPSSSSKHSTTTFLASRTRSEASPPRSKLSTRPPSPTISIASSHDVQRIRGDRSSPWQSRRPRTPLNEEGGRGRLWQEFRKVRQQPSDES